MTDDKQPATTKKNIVTVLRIVARVFGFIVTVFFLIVICAGGLQDGVTVESLFVIIPITVAVAGYITAWWRELSGGILLVAAYVLLAISPNIHALVYGNDLQFYTGIFIYGSPILVAGILYIVTWRLDRRYIKGRAVKQ